MAVVAPGPEAMINSGEIASRTAEQITGQITNAEIISVHRRREDEWQRSERQERTDT
ncbi:MULTISPECIES: hypothetical protein [Mycolicibacter]|uniref:hypothetical protein n=1 Tax=Mycolicibacter TaxID=1073531 RepID=UPI0013F4C022|nr:MULTISPECIES: hypothetical protein [Mycolicibacter]